LSASGGCAIDRALRGHRPAGPSVVVDYSLVCPANASVGRGAHLGVILLGCPRRRIGALRTVITGQSDVRYVIGQRQHVNQTKTNVILTQRTTRIRRTIPFEIGLCKSNVKPQSTRKWSTANASVRGWGVRGCTWSPLLAHHLHTLAHRRARGHHTAVEANMGLV
jgi:hypothetical protein